MTGLAVQAGRSRARSLYRLRRVVQWVAFLLFAALLVLAATAPATARWLMAFDPLTGLASMVASRSVSKLLLAGALAGLLFALVLGRAWCGWLCPLGALLDWTPARKPRPKEADLGAGWRRVKYFLLALIVFLAVLGNLSLLFLDPLTLFARTAAAAAWPAFNAVLSAFEQAAYALPFMQGPIDALEATRGGVLPAVQPLYGAGVLLALLFAGVLALNAVRPRFWCRYLCPLGALLGLVGKVAFIRREPGAACSGCSRCVRECPMGTIDAADGFRSNPAECTLCLACVEECPRDGQVFPGHVSLAPRTLEDPTRRQFLAAAGGAVVILGVLGIEPATQASPAHGHPHLVRPPGSQDPEFTSRCIRCGLCLRACPTSGLQPSVDVAGWSGAWTPVLVPRLGQCDYNCTACGQVCPTAAIPELDLETKRVTVIGRAYIDQNRCIPWTDGLTCLVCEEMCPLPEKAIKLEDVTVTTPDGEEAAVRRPHVVRERCIGCGICENRCPLPGDAAIRVFSAGEAV
ncbi:MAG: 4Fe-4S binding protein [Nitrososphaerales archaeon]